MCVSTCAQKLLVGKSVFQIDCFQPFALFLWLSAEVMSKIITFGKKTVCSLFISIHQLIALYYDLFVKV